MRRFAVPILFLALVAAVLLGLCVGASMHSVPEKISALLKGEGKVYSIIVHVRLPRVLCTLLCGAALAVAGALIQSVLNNPLAGPNIIGVIAGAGFGAVVCMAVVPSASSYMIGASAFTGAVLATLTVWGIARAAGFSKTGLVLAGVALSSLFNAGIDTVTTLVPDALASGNYFKIGGADGVTLRAVIPLMIVVPFAIVLACLFHHELSVLSLGGENAISLGLSPAVWRAVFLGLACILAGLAVSVAGLVGFVGLIVPHAVRLIGTSHGRFIPLCALGGGLLMTLCDLAARTLFSPFEIPVGIVLSVLGVPFFIWLLIRRRAYG